MGKSEFLEQDLIPAAQKLGLLTAYLNLWDAGEHPRGALISALARAGSPRGVSALIKKLKVPLKKVKASAKVSGIAEGSFEAELTEDPKIAGPALSDLLRSFDRSDRRNFFVAICNATSRMPSWVRVLRSMIRSYTSSTIQAIALRGSGFYRRIRLFCEHLLRA